MKKGNIGVETIFFILMAIIFAGILIFGFQQIFLIQDTISEADLVETKNKLEENLEYCDDPLNRGNFRLVEIDASQFNSICVIGENPLSNPALSSLQSELDIIGDAGDNVVLLNSNIRIVSGSYVLEDYNIIDSINAEVDIGNTFCRFDTEGRGFIELEVRCQ